MKNTLRFKKSRTLVLAQRWERYVETRLKWGELRRGAFDRACLRRLRHALGLTLQDAALRVGCSRSELSRLERSEIAGTLRLESLRKVLRGYACRLAYTPIPIDVPNFCELREQIASRSSARARGVAGSIQKVLAELEQESREFQES
jgi:transcriptional regulator with XRE-family HTH domain